MKKLKRYDPENSNPEIIDIIERMPTSFGRTVSLTIIVFTVFILVFGWIVKYPDTVTGAINISSDTPAVKLTANAVGNISLLASDTRHYVNRDDYVAIIQNSATCDDVVKIKRLLAAFDPDAPDFSDAVNRFPNRVFLGELNIKYYAFLSALKNRVDHYRDNVYERQRASIRDNTRGMESVCEETEKVLDIMSRKLAITRKWNDKYRSLNKDNVATYEYELDISHKDLLTMEQEEAIMRKDLASLRMQISENNNLLARLDVEQNEKERQLHLDILTSYHDLCDNITAWEQRYVLKAPVEGKLEYLKFIADNQYVQAGEELFGIIPQKSKMVGQVLLPSSGAGKINIGDKVTIKLDDYPYMEYGSVEGIVKNISLIPQARQTEKNPINTYMVEVELPRELTTNYGQKLQFKPNISGTADIIVNKRRLIERLFDNLRYSIYD